LSRPHAAAFGAFLDGRLVGTATVVHEARAKARHKAWLVAVYVAPEARRRGVGRAVVGAALEQARAWDFVEQVHLGVAVVNESALRLYRSFGFEPYGREPRAIKLPDRYVDEDLMVLRLH
jgi:ribosomal protein S18 acetylase RimI-like enzyme